MLALEDVGHPATTKRIGDQAWVAVGAGEFERRARPSEGFVMIVGPLGELGCNQLAAEPRAERTLVAQQGCRLIEIGTGCLERKPAKPDVGPPQQQVGSPQVGRLEERECLGLQFDGALDTRPDTRFVERSEGPVDGERGDILVEHVDAADGLLQ